ncbi:MAG: 3-phosphoshikimate 1-carboxyvinyltransferase, partial [Planctomycetota bacterium]
MPSSHPVLVPVPGSKSHAIRALVASALARGRSRVRGAPGGEDVARVVAALRDLDVRIDGEAGAGELVIEGTAGRFAPGQRHLRLGGSGTGLRFLAALAALRKGETILDGDKSLQRRSMEATINSVRQTGVVVQSAKGRAPLYVKDGPGSRPSG